MSIIPQYFESRKINSNKKHGESVFSSKEFKNKLKQYFKSNNNTINGLNAFIKNNPNLNLNEYYSKLEYKTDDDQPKTFEWESFFNGDTLFKSDQNDDLINTTNDGQELKESLNNCLILELRYIKKHFEIYYLGVVCLHYLKAIDKLIFFYRELRKQIIHTCITPKGAAKKLQELKRYKTSMTKKLDKEQDSFINQMYEALPKESTNQSATNMLIGGSNTNTSNNKLSFPYDVFNKYFQYFDKIMRTKTEYKSKTAIIVSAIDENELRKYIDNLKTKLSSYVSNLQTNFHGNLFTDQELINLSTPEDLRKVYEAYSSINTKITTRINNLSPNTNSILQINFNGGAGNFKGEKKEYIYEPEMSTANINHHEKYVKRCLKINVLYVKKHNEFLYFYKTLLNILKYYLSTYKILQKFTETLIYFNNCVKPYDKNSKKTQLKTEKLVKDLDKIKNTQEELVNALSMIDTPLKLDNPPTATGGGFSANGGADGGLFASNFSELTNEKQQKYDEIFNKLKEVLAKILQIKKDINTFNYATSTINDNDTQINSENIIKKVKGKIQNDKYGTILTPYFNNLYGDNSNKDFSNNVNLYKIGIILLKILTIKKYFNNDLTSGDAVGDYMKIVNEKYTNLVNVVKLTPPS